MAYRSFRGGSGRLHTRLDTPPSIKRRHPDSSIAPKTEGNDDPYAERNGLDYTWSGTALYAKRKRTLPANQFEVRAVRTRRGITMVGLFSASITRAEREAAAPYREAMAAKRLARMARG